MINLLIGLATIIGTIGVYQGARRFHQRFYSSFTLPVLTSTFFIIILLLVLHIPYDTYMVGAKWISELLGPAVVALAYPLYQHRQTLKKLVVPIVTGVSIGSFIGVFSGIVLAKWAGFDATIIYALAPKSVTTPVAMAITESLGGVQSLAAVLVMVAGIGGPIISSFVYKLFCINHSVGRGVGMGCASHAIGTATIMESSQIEGSISTVSMILSAIIVSVITPGLVFILL